MKNLVAAILILLCFGFTAHAVEDFSGEGWFEALESGSVIFTPSGTTLNVNASDGNADYAWGYYYKSFSGASGVSATLNISRFDGDGQFGLQRYVARNASGNRLRLEIYAQSWDGVKTLRYRIKERSDDLSTNKILTTGYFGEYTSDMWTIGENLTLGFWYNNSVAYFYCSKFPGQLSQVYLPQITSVMNNSQLVYTYVENNGHIEATVNNMNIDTSLSQLSAITGVSNINPVPVQSDLSFTVPSMSYESMDIWTKFKFTGEVDGKLMFELDSFGANE